MQWRIQDFDEVGYKLSMATRFFGWFGLQIKSPGATTFFGFFWISGSARKVMLDIVKNQIPER